MEEFQLTAETVIRISILSRIETLIITAQLYGCVRVGDARCGFQDEDNASCVITTRDDSNAQLQISHIIFIFCTVQVVQNVQITWEISGFVKGSRDSDRHCYCHSNSTRRRSVDLSDLPWQVERGWKTWPEIVILTRPLTDYCINTWPSDINTLL